MCYGSVVRGFGYKCLLTVYVGPSSRPQSRLLWNSPAVLWSSLQGNSPVGRNIPVCSVSCIAICMNDVLPLDKTFSGWYIWMKTDVFTYYNIVITCYYNLIITCYYCPIITCYYKPHYYLLLQTSLLPVITVPLLHHYYIVITCYYKPHYYLLLLSHYYIIITLLLPVITFSLLPVITIPLLHHYYIIITCYYILIITCYYSPIITSLLRHYYVIITSLLLHVIMAWLLPIITFACFIITSLLPIMSSILIITYYWLSNLQMKYSDSESES